MKTKFATGETVGLAEWIIHDTCLVVFVLNLSYICIGVSVTKTTVEIAIKMKVTITHANFYSKWSWPLGSLLWITEKLLDDKRMGEFLLLFTLQYSHWVFLQKWNSWPISSACENFHDQKSEYKTCVPSMIHSARPSSDRYSHLKVVLLCEILSSGEGQTTHWKIMITTGCGSASWINWS